MQDMAEWIADYLEHDAADCHTNIAEAHSFYEEDGECGFVVDVMDPEESFIISVRPATPKEEEG